MTSPAPRPIGDEELDRLLEAALSVSPSPTFRARVAARVAEAPLPGRGRHSLIWPAMAAVAAIAVAIAVATGPPADDGRRAPQAPIASKASAILSSPAAAIERRATAATRRSTDSALSRSVVVRFDRREQEAWAWLVARAKAGDLAPSAGEIDTTEIEPAVFPLAVLPLEVAPLEFTADSEGDPQP